MTMLMNRVVKMSESERPVARRSSRSSKGKLINHWM